MSLHNALLAAHDTHDLTALITGYTHAAQQASDLDQACFFLTHAYIFALEAADPRAHDLRAQLAAHGREPAD